MRTDENRQQLKRPEVKLSKTELAVISNIELPEKQIAYKMHRSVHTITRHMKNIREKLNKSDKVGLAI